MNYWWLQYQLLFWWQMQHGADLPGDPLRVNGRSIWLAWWERGWHRKLLCLRQDEVRRKYPFTYPQLKPVKRVAWPTPIPPYPSGCMLRLPALQVSFVPLQSRIGWCTAGSRLVDLCPFLESSSLLKCVCVCVVFPFILGIIYKISVNVVCMLVSDAAFGSVLNLAVSHSGPVFSGFCPFSLIFLTFWG